MTGYTQSIDQKERSAASRMATQDFIRRPNQYVLLNSTNQDIYFEWHAEKRVVPAANRYTPVHPKALKGDSNFYDVPHSAQDEKGGYIPGTLILKDILRAGPFGSVEVLWSAMEAIQEKLGIDPNTGEYTGAYALRGLSLLPHNATPEQIAEIAAEGRVRWETWQLDQDRRTMLEEKTREDAHKAKNIPLPPAPQYVEEAAARLRIFAQRQNQSITEVIFGKDNPDVAAVKQEMKQEPQPQPLNKFQALAEVLDDPDMLELLRKKLAKLDAPAAPSTPATNQSNNPPATLKK